MTKSGGYIIVCMVSAVVGGLAGGIIVTYLARHTTSEVVVTKKLVIVDQAGHERATLETHRNQEVSLDLFAPDHARQISLGVMQNAFADPSDPAFDQKSGQQKWVPTLEIDDESGRKAALFRTSDHGNARLDFYAADENWREGLGYIGDGSDYGSNGGAWGLRVRKSIDLETSMGILDYDTHGYSPYMTPMSSSR